MLCISHQLNIFLHEETEFDLGNEIIVVQGRLKIPKQKRYVQCKLIEDKYMNIKHLICEQVVEKLT